MFTKTVAVDPPVVGKKRPVILGNPFKEVLKITFDEVQTYTIKFNHLVGSPQNTDVPDMTITYKILKIRKFIK